MKQLNYGVYLIIFISGNLMAGKILAVTFGDCLARHFLAGDFFCGYGKDWVVSRVVGGYPIFNFGSRNISKLGYVKVIHYRKIESKFGPINCCFFIQLVFVFKCSFTLRVFILVNLYLQYFYFDGSLYGRKVQLKFAFKSNSTALFPVKLQLIIW